MAYESESELIQAELENEYSGEGEEEMEGEFEDESALEGEGWLGTIGNVVGSLLGEGEAEEELAGESSFEAEDEDELNPIRKIYPDAMMEHLGELAAQAETEDEAAEHFLPLIGMAASKLLPVAAKALAPLAKRALPKIARAVTRTTPHLSKGVGKIAKTLHRNPQTRHLLRAVPAIARRTVGSVATQAARGRHITPRSAIRTLATQTKRVLAHPQHRHKALRRHYNLERRFHRHFGRGLVRPHSRAHYGRYPVQYSRPAVPAPAGYVRAGATPSTAYQPSTPGAGPVRYGQVVGGQCQCAACPACGAAPAPQQTVAASPAPTYCRCCGQLLR